VEKERPARSTTISARIYLPSFRDARMFIRRTVSKYTQIASLHNKTHKRSLPKISEGL